MCETTCELKCELNNGNRLSFGEFKEVVTNIYTLNKAAEDYTETLRAIDASFASYLEENEKVEFLYRINDSLMMNLFGDMAEDIYWLFYEWKLGMAMNFEVNDKKYTINNLEDFFNYIFEVYYTPALEPFILPEVEVKEERMEEREVFAPTTDGGIVGKIKRLFGL